MAGRAKESLPGGSLKYLFKFVYLNVVTVYIYIEYIYIYIIQLVEVINLTHLQGLLLGLLHSSS